MKKIILLLVVTISLLIYSNLEARSWCCSHHWWVCGCWCCDGSSLSATCAPYYPECNSSSSDYLDSSNVPTTKTVISNSSYIKPEPIASPLPKSSHVDNSTASEPISKTSSASVEMDKKDDSSYSWILFLALIWSWFYFLKTKKK